MPGSTASRAEGRGAEGDRGGWSTGRTSGIGTTIDWRLRKDGDYTIVLFAHQGWAEPVGFMPHCSTKWATFLLSLKSLVESGEGAPAPRDVVVSDWH